MKLNSGISFLPATDPFYSLFWLGVPYKDGSLAEKLQVLTNPHDKPKHHMHVHHHHLVKLTQIHCFTSSGKNCMTRLSAQYSPTLTHSNLMQSPLLSMLNSVTNSGTCQAWLKEQEQFVKYRTPYQTCPFQYCYQLSSGAGFRPSLQPSWSPLIFPFLFAVEELYSIWYQSGSFSLFDVGSGFHCLRSLSILSFL